MAREVGIAQESSSIAYQDNTAQLAQAGVDISKAIMRGASVVDEVRNANKKALGKSQVAKGQDENKAAWDVANAENSNNYNEEKSDEGISKLAEEQRSAINDNKDLTDDARTNLLLGVDSEEVNAKRLFGINSANAMNKETIRNTNATIERKVRGLNKEEVNIAIDDAIADGVIHASAGEGMKIEAGIQIDFYESRNTIEQAETQEEVRTKASDVLANTDYDSSQRSSLIATANGKLSTLTAGSTSYDTFLNERLNDAEYGITEEMIAGHPDPAKKAFWMARLGEQQGGAELKRFGRTSDSFTMYQSGDTTSPPVVFKTNPSFYEKNVKDNVAEFKLNGTIRIPKITDGVISNWGHKGTLKGGAEAYTTLIHQINNGPWSPSVKSDMLTDLNVGADKKTNQKWFWGAETDNTTNWFVKGEGKNVNSWTEDSRDAITAGKAEFDSISGLFTGAEIAGAWSDVAVAIDRAKLAGKTDEEAVNFGMKSLKEKSAQRKIKESLISTRLKPSKPLPVQFGKRVNATEPSEKTIAPDADSFLDTYGL